MEYLYIVSGVLVAFLFALPTVGGSEIASRVIRPFRKASEVLATVCVLGVVLVWFVFAIDLDVVIAWLHKLLVGGDFVGSYKEVL